MAPIEGAAEVTWRARPEAGAEILDRVARATAEMDDDGFLPDVARGFMSNVRCCLT